MSTGNEILKFSFAGIVVVSADFGIYYLFIHFLPYDISKGISFTSAGVIGYLLNKYLVFKNNQSSYAQMGRFIFVNFLALGINVFINQWMLKSFHSPVWLALITATAVTNVLIFISFKWWVFKK